MLVVVDYLSTCLSINFYAYFVLKEHLVKDGLALDFLLTVFVTWKQEKGASSLTTALRKAGIDSRYIHTFFICSTLLSFLYLF
jgi:hypothetical protein